jgi:hypothetical protein
MRMRFCIRVFRRLAKTPIIAVPAMQTFANLCACIPTSLGIRLRLAKDNRPVFTEPQCPAARLNQNLKFNVSPIIPMEDSLCCVICPFPLPRFAL